MKNIKVVAFTDKDGLLVCYQFQDKEGRWRENTTPEGLVANILRNFDCKLEFEKKIIED